jgi:hypothetical protein
MLPPSPLASAKDVTLTERAEAKAAPNKVVRTTFNAITASLLVA